MTHIQKCPICDIEFKPADLCADDIEMGTCHAKCLEDSPVVDLDTGQELPEGSKPDTYFFAEMDGQKPFAWYWYDSLGCLYMTGDARKPEVPADAKPLYERPAPPPQAHVDWSDMAFAPKDGTMVRLLVNPDPEEFTAFDDNLTPFETIGFNNLENTEEDRWEFAGWDWSQDCFITGRGEVIGWTTFGCTPSPSTNVGGSSFIADVHAIVDGQDFGKPTAEKRGRSSDLPYVPVIDHGDRTEQIKGFAFPDRAAAIEHAAKTIALRRAYLFQQLKEPRLRALRQSHGLPADIPATPAPVSREEGNP